jgi:hypothetical protein
VAARRTPGRFRHHTIPSANTASPHGSPPAIRIPSATPVATPASTTRHGWSFGHPPVHAIHADSDHMHAAANGRSLELLKRCPQYPGVIASRALAINPAMGPPNSRAARQHATIPPNPASAIRR